MSSTTQEQKIFNNSVRMWHTNKKDWSAQEKTQMKID